MYFESIWVDDQSTQNNKTIMRPTLKTADTLALQSNKQRRSPKTPSLPKKLSAAEKTKKLTEHTPTNAKTSQSSPCTLPQTSPWVTMWQEERNVWSWKQQSLIEIEELNAPQQMTGHSRMFANKTVKMLLALVPTSLVPTRRTHHRVLSPDQMAMTDTSSQKAED